MLFVLVERIENAVALFTRAWIEIEISLNCRKSHSVALFTRAWIEIDLQVTSMYLHLGRPLHEGVD